MDQDRSSEADVPKLVEGREQIAHIEAENTLRQFDFAMSELADWLSNPNYRLRPSTILKLNRYALDGLSEYAGIYRPAGVKIKGSKHEPVAAADVASEIEDLCEYIHNHWSSKTAVHLAAYALWRLNWIHPFVDGNGRTARAVSYLILCAKFGARIPGKKTIPEQIAAKKAPYYKALEDADAHYKVGKKINVGVMETLLDGMLAGQLLSIHQDATGNHDGSNRTETTNLPDGEKLPRSSKERTGIIGWIEAHPVVAGGIFLLLAALVTAMAG